MPVNSAILRSRFLQEELETNTSAQIRRFADFDKLDFQTQARMTLPPLMRGGVDIRKTLFVKTIPAGMLERAVEAVGLCAQPQCEHSGTSDRKPHHAVSTGLTVSSTDVQSGPPELDIEGVFCHVCHQLYCEALEFDNSGGTSDEEDAGDLPQSGGDSPMRKKPRSSQARRQGLEGKM